MDLSAAIALVSAAISLVAVLVSLRTARAQNALSAKLAEEEHQLLFEQVRMQRDSDILSWTEACIRSLAECEFFVEHLDPGRLSEENRILYRDLRCRLSALIDQGRLFFPNETPEMKGAENPVAYRGFRQRILSFLVHSFDEFSKFERLGSEDQRQALVATLNDLRRKFVSEAQVAIDPRRFIALKEMNDLKRQRGLQVQKLEDREDI